MEDLLEELLAEVLVKLPVESLLRFKTVCKAWYDLISTPVFIRRHLKHEQKKNIMFLKSASLSQRLFLVDYNVCQDTYSEELDIAFEFGYSNSIFNSCHGLLLVYDYKNRGYYIWNPSTGKYRCLPPVPHVEEERRKSLFHLGFGYDSCSGYYKVLFVESFDSCCEISLYRSSTYSWKRLYSIPYTISNKHSDGDPPMMVLVNNTLIWIAITNNSSVILSFDLIKEETREVNLPKYGEGEFLTEIVASDDCVCVSAKLCNSSTFYIWVLREESWTKVFCFIPEMFAMPFVAVHPLHLSAKGDLLLHGYSISARLVTCCLILYHSKTNITEILCVKDKYNLRRAHITMESLVSPNEAVSPAMPDGGITMGIVEKKTRRGKEGGFQYKQIGSFIQL